MKPEAAPPADATANPPVTTPPAGTFAPLPVPGTVRNEVGKSLAKPADGPRFGPAPGPTAAEPIAAEPAPVTAPQVAPRTPAAGNAPSGSAPQIAPRTPVAGSSPNAQVAPAPQTPTTGPAPFAPVAEPLSPEKGPAANAQGAPRTESTGPAPFAPAAEPLSPTPRAVPEAHTPESVAPTYRFPAQVNPSPQAVPETAVPTPRTPVQVTPTPSPRAVPEAAVPTPRTPVHSTPTPRAAEPNPKTPAAAVRSIPPARGIDDFRPPSFAIDEPPVKQAPAAPTGPRGLSQDEPRMLSPEGAATSPETTPSQDVTPPNEPVRTAPVSPRPPRGETGEPTPVGPRATVPLRAVPADPVEAEPIPADRSAPPRNFGSPAKEPIEGEPIPADRPTPIRVTGRPTAKGPLEAAPEPAGEPTPVESRSNAPRTGGEPTPAAGGLLKTPNGMSNEDVGEPIESSQDPQAGPTPAGPGAVEATPVAPKSVGFGSKGSEPKESGTEPLGTKPVAPKTIGSEPDRTAPPSVGFGSKGTGPKESGTEGVEATPVAPKGIGSESKVDVAEPKSAEPKSIGFGSKGTKPKDNGPEAVEAAPVEPKSVGSEPTVDAGEPKSATEPTAEPAQAGTDAGTAPPAVKRTPNAQPRPRVFASFGVAGDDGKSVKPEDMTATPSVEGAGIADLLGSEVVKPSREPAPERSAGPVGEAPQAAEIDRSPVKRPETAAEKSADGSAEKATPGRPRNLDTLSPDLIRPEQAQPIYEESPGSKGSAGAQRRDPELPALDAELTELAVRLRQVRETFAERIPNTREHTHFDVVQAILGNGVKAELKIDGPQPRTVNAIAYQSYNNLCKGEEILFIERNAPAVRVGPRVQNRPGQFLAALAQAGVPLDYPLKVKGKTFTVADLVATEKRGCESTMGLSFKLLALSYYVDASDESWVSATGQPWSLERLIREEIAAPVVDEKEYGGTQRLLALSAAVRRRQGEGKPLDGQFGRAAKYVSDFHRYALGLQNPDGSFSTEFFRKKSNIGDAQAKLRTTGMALEWLVFSLDRRDLDHPSVVKAVNFVVTLLEDHAADPFEAEGLAHALHALRIYEERFITPPNLTTAARDAAGKKLR